jgi:hypothetical protein
MKNGGQLSQIRPTRGKPFCQKNLMPNHLFFGPVRLVMTYRNESSGFLFGDTQPSDL